MNEGLIKRLRVWCAQRAAACAGAAASSGAAASTGAAASRGAAAAGIMFAIALLATMAPAHAGVFALFGDIPYSAHEVEALRLIIDEMNRDDELAFVVHDGDIKSGSSKCDDRTFLDRKADFEASRHPFILIPGDNEWTDCHRPSNGPYDPEERLEKLRELFFATDESLGRRKIKLTRQGDLQPQYAAWRENVRWEFENVLLMGVNIPGSNNNWKNTGANTEFHARLKANTAWIAANFRTARENNMRAVMLIIQANPDFEGTEAARLKRQAGYRDGFAEFKAQLLEEAKAFRKPVVVVHGDTHSHQINQPLKDGTGVTVSNVTRLETPGSPFVGWVRTVIDANDPKVFQFTVKRFGASTPPGN